MGGSYNGHCQILSRGSMAFRLTTAEAEQAVRVELLGATPGRDPTLHSTSIVLANQQIFY